MYERINKRIMMSEGLLRKQVCAKELNAPQTVGYRELFRYFDREISLEFAIEEIKKNHADSKR
jgi:tRNA dimethylallyltransferase